MRHLITPLRFFLLVVVACRLTASNAIAATTFPSWNQDLSDARKDRYVDVDLNPADFKTAWYASLGMGTGFYDRGVATDGRHVYRTTRRIPVEDVKGYRVLAFDISNGELVWEQPIYGYYHPHELGEPAVMNGVVYANREGHSALSYVPERPHLFGLDANTGQIVSDTEYASQWGTKDRPTLVDGHVIAAGGYFGGLYSFAPGGGIQWFNNRGGDAEVSVVADGRIYRAQGEVLDLATGRRLGDVVHPGALMLNIPMISEDDVIFYTAYDPLHTEDRRVATFDLTTQSHRKDFEFSDIPLSFAAGDGRLAVKFFDGVRFYDEASGVNYLHWVAPSPDYSTEMILTNSHLFLHVGPNITAINVLTGETEWTFSTHSGDMALGDGFLFVSGDAGITAISVVIPEPNTLLLISVGATLLLVSWQRRSPIRIAKPK